MTAVINAQRLLSTFTELPLYCQRAFNLGRRLAGAETGAALCPPVP